MDKLLNKTDKLISDALRLWGIKDFNLDSIDPLVRLLIACVADESNKLEGKLNETANSIEQLLVNTLLPWDAATAKPAFAMIQATPLEASFEFDEAQSFVSHALINQNGKQEQTAIDFRPVYQTKIINATVSSFFNWAELYIHNTGTSFFPKKKASTKNSIWLGLSADDSVTSLSGLSLFVHPRKNWFEQAEHAGMSPVEGLRAFHNGKELWLEQGFNPNQIITDKNRAFKSKTENVLSYYDLVQPCLDTYNRSYFRINSHDPDVTPLTRSKHPVFLKDLFSQEDLEQLEEDLVWIELKLQPSAPFIAEHMNIFINAFPVINLKPVAVDLSRDEPIIKVPAGGFDHFLGVLDFEAFDMFHNSIAHDTFADLPFILRSIDMEQFALEDAAGGLEKTIDNFENSFHVFYEHFSLDQDDIERLHEAIRPVRESLLNINKNQPGNSQHYLIFKPEIQKETDNLQVLCLNTKGHHGNDILQGTTLKTNNSLIQGNSLQFITKTRGGRKPLEYEEKVKHVQHLLTSHNQLVTKEDVLQYCYLHLAEKAKMVTVTDAVMLLGDNLRKCIKVNIAIDKACCGAEEIVDISREMQSAIERKSGFIVPVNVNVYYG